MPPDSHDFQALFPEMEPLSKPPALFTFNGIGLRMAGKRDEHFETGSFVKTRFISVLFIPLLALDAYRVMDAPGGGWYFLGQEKLSTFARRWNVLFVALLLGLGGAGSWLAYVSSPAYRASQQLKRAQLQIEAGRLTAAMKIYLQVYKSHKPMAQQRALRLLNAGLGKASGGELVKMFGHLTQQPQLWLPKGLLVKRGRDQAKRFEASKPRISLKLLQIIAAWLPEAEQKRHLLKRQELLQVLVKKHPKDPALASELALCYEASEGCRRCAALLRPHEKRLGLLEGARILGQWYAKKQRLAASNRLLMPYVEGRLKRLHQAQKRYDAAVERVRQETIRALKAGRGPAFFYDPAFRKLSLHKRKARIVAYVQQQLKASPQVYVQRLALSKAASVVPVAMKLGVVKLQRARKLPDPDARRKELKAAEGIFLAIRGVAGRSQRYKLYLGQVYYWLGKQSQGSRLFEEILRKSKRHPSKLLLLGRILREIGNRAEARQMAEEAYSKATQKQLKADAATLRALTSLHVDTKILWLKRADLSAPGIAALLYNAQGNRAWQRGQKDNATIYYRKAISAYQKLDKTPSSLNNSALAYFSLFRTTGERKAFHKGVRMLGEAISLRPSDSILLFNAADAQLRAAILDMMPRYPLHKLQLQLELGLLSSLYRNAAERQALFRKLRAHRGYRWAKTYYTKVLVLAPNNALAYNSLAQLHHYGKDLQGMRDLYARLKEARIDRESVLQNARAMFSGKRDASLRKSYLRELKNLARLKLAAKGPQAAALTRRVSLRMAWYQFGGAIDVHGLVRRARKAYRLSPSSSTRQGLIAAYLFRAALAWGKRSKDFALYLSHCRRSLSPPEILLARWVHSRREGRRIARLLDVKRAVRIALRQARALPKQITPFGWALLHTHHPRLGKSMAAWLKADALGQTYRKVIEALNPMSAHLTLQMYWAAMASKRPKRAQQILKRALKRGIPLPIDASLPAVGMKRD